jgi:site-specific recombinase XerD
VTRWITFAPRSWITFGLLFTPVEQFGKKDKFYKSLACFAKFLISENELDESFLENLRKLKPKRHLPPKRTVVNELELGRLIEACTTVLDKTLVIVLSQTGLRASECAALKIRDINFEQQTLTVQVGKGGKRRFVGLSLETLKTVQHYLGSRISMPEQSLFLNAFNLPLDRNGIRMRLDKLSRVTGIKVNAHSLRRAFVTINANKGRPLQMLQIACGHSDINTTRSYCMTTEQEVIDAMKNWR